MHPCDDQMPLLIMLDDFYGNTPYSAIRQTGNVYMLSTWHNLMAVNYGNTIKYKVLVEANETTYHPLIHGASTLHPSIAGHIGIAWTLFFNIIDSMVDICNDGDIGKE